MRIQSLLSSAILVFVALIASQAHAARSIRADNPGNLCDLLNWVPTGVGYPAGNTSANLFLVSGFESVTVGPSQAGPLPPAMSPYQGIDPYAQLDGSASTPTSFFQPGTTVAPGTLIYCVPNSSLSIVWNNDPSGTQPANLVNPASLYDSTLTATVGVMYEWVNQIDMNPDAEVMVWTIPANTGSHSAISWPGGFELELDNWCSPNDNGFGSGPSANAVASFSWNGNTYKYNAMLNGSIANCSTFNGYDLLINSWGVLIGYVEYTKDPTTNNTVVMTSTSTAPGWTVQLVTTTMLSLPSSTVEANSPVTLQAAVSSVPGGSVPGGSVTFNIASSALGSAPLVGGVATLTLSAGLSADTYEITASYGGDSVHATSSSSSSQALTVTAAPSVTMSETPTGMKVTPGQSATTVVTLTPNDGFDQTMSLACSGLPAGSTCDFSPVSVTVNGHAATSTLTITTNAASAMNLHVPAIDPLVPGGVLLAGIGLPTILRRHTRMKRRYDALRAIPFFVALMLASCGGGSSGSSSSTGGSAGTPGGSYSVTITATAPSTTKSVTYALTVT